MRDIIKVENVSKQYRLGIVGTGTLAHDLNRWWHRIRGNEDPYLGIGEANDRTIKGTSEYVWALRDVNFGIGQGEIVGIIGRNGAGKSTLLKILSRTTAPTTGTVKIKGRVASLLEVGTGFHPELSGRENIFLNGAILGMTRREIKNKFSEIVEFSGVERYIDTPVKRYSSGMYIRLAFAVAAHLESEVLIVDEVLAVGDADFQKKCLGKMKDVSSSEGRTVLLVSHNMGSIKALCSRCILVDKGKIAEDGDPTSVTSRYLKGDTDNEGEFLPGKEAGYHDLIINRVRLMDTNGELTQDYNIGDDLVVEVGYTATRRIEQPYFWIGIKATWGTLFAANGLIDGIRTEAIEGTGSFRVTFKNIKLFPQTYSVWMGARDQSGNQLLISSKEVGSFNIITKLTDLGFSALAERLSFDSAPMITDYVWDFGNNEIHEMKSDMYVKR